MKDPYSVLGLDKTSSPEALKARYDELKSLYGEQRFKPGEEGNEGARKLHDLEESWIYIQQDLEARRAAEREQAQGSAFSGASASSGEYARVDELIRSGKYNEAQAILDGITDRDGEWHYYQSIIFYKREWLTESKTQLEMAIQCDPNNAKYKNALEKLKVVMGGVKTDPSTMSTTGAAPAHPAGNMDDAANCLSSCCCAYCLTDCLCSALRCM